MIEHSRHHTARTAGRSRHDLTSASILLGNGQRIRIDHPTAFDAAAIPFGTDHIVGCLTPDSQATGQNPLGLEPVTDCLLHHFPYFGQIVPYLRSFALFDIFPVGMTCFFAPSLYVLNGVHFVDLALRQLIVGFVCQRSTPDTVDRPVIQFLSAFVKRLEQDTVRVERQEHLRFPGDIGLGHRAQNFENCRICHVTFACGRQTTIERNVKSHSAPIAFQKHPGGTHRPHRVATGRSVTDPVYLFD
ncbi:unknown [Parabacteroides johnsonii CAG:246]|nr:unknown [Parabacteroides johnsonii CAG:246]